MVKMNDNVSAESSGDIAEDVFVILALTLAFAGGLVIGSVIRWVMGW